MVLESCAGIVTERGKLIVYCTGVTNGVMVIDSSTAIVSESGKLILYFTVVSFRPLKIVTFHTNITSI
jgi:hypothetical protein